VLFELPGLVSNPQVALAGARRGSQAHALDVLRTSRKSRNAEIRGRRERFRDFTNVRQTPAFQTWRLLELGSLPERGPPHTRAQARARGSREPARESAPREISSLSTLPRSEEPESLRRPAAKLSARFKHPFDQTMYENR